MSTSTQHFFSADRPIERLDDDRLQRRSFALSIAQAITTWHGEHSLVIALYGGWGDGKTSVKGMVVDAMNKDTENCPFIVHFNPWEWAGQNQLAQVFFDEIGKEIAHQGSGKDKEKAAACGRRLQKLGNYLNLTGAFMTPLGYAVNAAFPFGSIVMEAAAKGLKKSGELAKQAGEAVQEQNERKESTLLTVKSDLRQALTALKRNVVVMVDDIDRLAADEIKVLFQLIKANSDFPNLIFFLFFQRDIIERALGRTIRTGTGKDYLEKIVQVPLSLPEIQRPLLERFMDSKLRDLLARRALEKNFDWSRFLEMWHKGISGYFQNARDAARFFATFEFQVAAFPNPAEFDPVDLFTLEVLRVFEPGVHAVLASSRPLLALDGLDHFTQGIEKVDIKGPWNKWIKQIVDLGNAAHPDSVEVLLKSLFPMETLLWSLRAPEKLGPLLKQARVGHPAFFGRYFHLCIPQGDIPQTELIRLLNAISTPRKFRRQLAKLDKQHLALEALKRLLAYADCFDPRCAGVIASALFDDGDLILGKYSDSLWDGFTAMACLLIEGHLERLPLGSDRFMMLKSSFEVTNGVYLVASMVSRESSRVEAYKRDKGQRGFSREECRVLEEAQLNELAHICIRNFHNAAESGALQRHPKLKELLGWWLIWSRPSDKAKVYFRKLVASDDGLIGLLEQYLCGKLREDSHRDVFEKMFDHGLSEVELFMPLDQVKVRVDALAKKQISERVDRLCSVFVEEYSKHVHNRSAFPGATPRTPDSTT